MIILVDMDGVIADFEKQVLETYKQLYPHSPYIPLEERTTFYVKDQYPKKVRSLLEKIYLAEGFYNALPTIEGTIPALYEMLSLKNEVFICTSPLLQNPHCIDEKYAWVKEKLGEEWVKRLIITKEKNTIAADVLIDDNPHVKGEESAVWEHILYTQPYNAHVTSKRRLTWKTWKEVLGF